MIPLIFLGLLTIAVLLLVDRDYISFKRWPEGLGWGFQFTDADQYWGFRVQWERYPVNRVGKRWRYERSAPWLQWPRCLHGKFKNFTIFLYLGTARQ